MLLVASTFAWVLMEENDKYTMRKECAQKSPVSHSIILLKPSCVCCDGLSSFLRPEVHSVSDEHHKVLSIKCLLLNPIKWISFPFHNIIMSQKPFFSALYILFLITSYHGLSYLSQLHCLISLWGKRKKWLLFLVGSFKDILHRKKLVWN